MLHRLTDPSHTDMVAYLRAVGALPAPHRAGSHTVKLAADLLTATLILAAVAPVMLLVALALVLEGGPVLSAERCLGRGGRVFAGLRFRTATPGPVPRRTPLGRWLHHTHLDELPQLFNVLRLDMSLVGPAPIAPDDARRYGADLGCYCAMRPGITGPWQLTARARGAFDQKLRLDRWYARNWSLRQDALILLRTLPQVLFPRAAG